MGLNSVGIDIYDIHKYFCELTVVQWTPGFWGVTYQASLKGEKKNVEMNFTNINGLDLSYYDVDFFGGPNEISSI